MGELEIFAIRIKELRKSLNMTQKEFSEHIGVKQQTLSGYERGIMKPPLDIAKGIAEKCNISIDWLCGLTDKMNYNGNIETYSDVIDFLCRLEQTEIGMIVSYIPKLGIPMLKPLEDIPMIMFNNIKMCNFLKDYESVTIEKDNTPFKKYLYDLWIKDVMKKYNVKLEYDGLFKEYNPTFEEMAKSIKEALKEDPDSDRKSGKILESYLYEFIKPYLKK